MRIKGVWCGSDEAGRTRESVAEYVDRMHRAGFNCILIHLKGGDGRLYWPSKLFPEAIAPGYEEFDLPAHIATECKKRGMECHAWLIDYFEGEDGPAYRRHPEWAVRDMHGRTSADETLRGKRFGCVWMCPAQRPGYTDQWLVPLLREFAERYDFDAIHHDYIRYPGDVAPDSYCFCDYCLENIPRFCGYRTEAFPEEPFYHALYDRPYLEAHWEQSPRVLPANWERLDSASKSRFLLEGGFFQGGRNDLDYFFYGYRTHWVAEFSREAAVAVRAARPGMKLSAAVFKNPIHSGRFIGQDWRLFAPYVDTCIPMDYRDHYPGSVDTYLTLLAETIGEQKVWARDFKEYCVGFAINFLFAEEEAALARLLRAADEGDALDAREPYRTIEARLRIAAPDLAEHVADFVAGGASPSSVLTSFCRDVPPSFWPCERVEKVVDVIRRSGVDGMVMFCEGHLNQYGLWDTVTRALNE